MAVCDLVDHDQLVSFRKTGGTITHEKTGEVIHIHRRGGKFEINAKVLHLGQGNGRGQESP